LIARITTNARDDRHERRQCRQLTDRVLELPDDPRRQERRDEIDRQPWPSIARAVERRGEEILITRQPGSFQRTKI